MRNINLFVEDRAHQLVIGTLLRCLAKSEGVEVNLNWRRSRGGFSRVVRDFKEYLEDFGQESSVPDLIVVASDSNCMGYNQRSKEINELITQDISLPVVLAIPDPHIERWLLIDSKAFKTVFGKGCEAPDMQCERNRYKELLRQSIEDAGIRPSLSGIEFAEDIVNAMDIQRAMRADASFKKFVEDIRRILQQWKSLD